MAKARKFTSTSEFVLVEVKVGDVVGFKCDVEQYGKIIAIKARSFGGYDLTLQASGTFYGEYIGGQKQTVVMDQDCWID